MIGITALFTAAFGLLAWITKPGTALGILIASMMIWPTYLRIPVGPASMSAPRLIAAALLIKLVFFAGGRRIRFCGVDWMVLSLWIWIVIASVISGSPSTRVIQFIGQGFDTTLMYFVARMSIRSMHDTTALAKPLFLVAAYLCVLGWIEAITSYAPYRQLLEYKSWVFIKKLPSYRLGMLRAKTSMSVHIFYGMAMMQLAGISWALRSNIKVKKIATMTAIIAAIGALASLSSGPWLAIVILIIANAYILHPKLIKPTWYIIIALAAFLEIASNRHFYNLIDYLALNSQTAWYRTRLLEVFFSEWRVYWLFGVGDTDINYWGSLLDGRGHIDLVNNYVIQAVNGGFLAAGLYIFSHIFAIRYGIKARKKSTENAQRVYIFCLICTLIALDISSISTGLFGAPLMLSYILLGILVSASQSWVSISTEQKRPILKTEPPGLEGLQAKRERSNRNNG